MVPNWYLTASFSFSVIVNGQRQGGGSRPGGGGTGVGFHSVIFSVCVTFLTADQWMNHMLVRMCLPGVQKVRTVPKSIKRVTVQGV